MAFHQSKPIAIGMVGGGPDSGIGETHRIAMRIDNKCELVAGAFSRSREKSLLVAKELRIASERVYDNYQSMADAEHLPRHDHAWAVSGNNGSVGKVLACATAKKLPVTIWTNRHRLLEHSLLLTKKPNSRGQVC
jgi:hypothetical protein